MIRRYLHALLTLSLITGMSATAVAQELSAREIAVKSDTRYTGDSSRADAQLILIDRKGRERVRDIRLYSLDQPEVEKSISFFVSPNDVAGTTYMNYDYDDEKDDDSWLYLPALKQVRRVAAGDKSGSFMGSDFTYSDINGVNTDWYNYTMLDENAEVDGAAAWKIESTPKPEFKDKVESETGYLKSHMWIRKDNFVQVQGQIWTQRKGRMKYYSAQQLELIDGIWTPLRLQMITVRNNEKEHASVFQFSNFVYNEHTDDALFTTQSMQRGIQ
ncbi:outer membrane lipoprotein-sorting protein [Gilvimarinus sp. SDUM040013]|uniref:Outer membrane lipoprotein-sorting protein n=1 Tax=Gilvimarinus gilvus TaxID=3058038 RepID=A0ABU4S1Q2_9GAMM|nr:outer membrane lipoprotein-sorting protein [Gilvimarinus sp. SDUM040013]MDO3386583.1 outer membrane lipoprotein-sorting protein [Gilvimarinus sp. SDUM040013]MDX6849159.1 outer membrane lipoprotein-sorting protein [Gilvimarinus sp. SDUM040013]